MSEFSNDLENVNDADFAKREEQQKEALKIPKGTYEGQVVKATPQTSDYETFKNGGRNPYYDIEVQSLQVLLFDVPFGSHGNIRNATAFVNICEKRVLRSDGGYEGATRQFIDLAKAVGYTSAPDMSDLIGKVVDGPRFKWSVNDKGYISGVRAL